MSAELKTKIEQNLKNFATNNLKTTANNFFGLLGYESSRTKNITKEDFRLRFESYEQQQNKQIGLVKKALFESWTNVHLLFQITDSEINFSKQSNLLQENEIQETNFSSYIFFAIELEKENFSRTELAQATRSINKIFKTPVLVLFKHKNKITIAIINRRKNKSDETKDVLEKVTLIKDINFENPHRAHLEILFDLSIEKIRKTEQLKNFSDLHKNWEKILDTKALNNKFYKEIANWYFWAVANVKFPDDLEKNAEKRNAQNIIRLLTRIIFVWFLKEKNLIPEELFSEQKLREILSDLIPENSTFYRAILQNLFFATLNVPISERKFRSDKNFQGKNPDFQNHFRFRYKNCFKNENSLENLFAEIPFLNGGLFECLDSETAKTDCFSENPKNHEKLSVPNFLFFSQKQQTDLNTVFETKNKTYEVEGLVRILKHYKFTIAENTPVEEEIALDPELLGRVFENLLASYNEETKTTARKETGSFYTPREIVDFMVDESLLAYLTQKTQKISQAKKLSFDELTFNQMLRETLSYTEKNHPFDKSETQNLISAVNEVKILDPACGSGAFPMGILHKLVFLLSKLDPENENWKRLQIQKQTELIKQDIQTAEKINDLKAREKAENELKERLENIENIFSDKNELDYSRKLFLIENCIFGVDIQTAAIQISKLRFFISLVIHQTKNQSKENYGILTLPNLETKFICANSLLGVKKPKQVSVFEFEEITEKENELRKIREKHFNARTQKEKDFCRKQDQTLRTELKQLFEKGLGSEDSELLVSWDPYNQNQSANFFDSEWMFCQKEGFDVVIGNPPYVQIQKFSGKPEQTYWENQKFETFVKTGDVYCLFYEKGFQLLKPEGILTFITSNKWMRAGYGEKLRTFFLNKTNPLKLIDFGGFQVFETATVDTNILVFQKSKNGKKTFACQFKNDFERNSSVSDYFEKNSFCVSSFSESNWVILNRTEFELKQKIEKIGTKLKDWEISINYGIKTGFNEAFIVDRKTRDELVAKDPKSAEILKPILRGRDIKKYQVDFADLWLIFIPWHFPLHKDPKIIGASKKAEKIFKTDYPHIYNHLLKFKDNLSSRNKAETGISYEWYALQRCANTYYGEFEKEKIVWANIAYDSCFCYSDSTLFINAPANLLTSKSKNIKYLLAFMNSKIFNWNFSHLGIDLGKAFEWKSQYVEQLPIPKLSEQEQLPFVEKVELILSGKEKGENTSDLEREIDLMVYKLYDLSEEEIKIIEKN